jgi:hypothetical protein
MKKVFFIILISCFSLTIFSCAKKEEEKDAPVIAEVYPVTTPTSDPTPDYTFSSTKAGTITYGGSCSSGTTSAISGNNTITFLTLSDGTYSDCTIIVTDSAGNASNTLAINTFMVDTTPKWAQEAYVKASNNDAGDSFGGTGWYSSRSIALDGDTLAVGAYNEDSNQTTITNGTTSSSDNSNSSSGAVYVYKRTGTTWAQEAYIKASNNDGNDEFGYSVALEGHTIAVGAFKEDSNQTTITNGATSSSNDSNNSSGAVYVYKRTGTTWEQEAYIKASNSDTYDYFGNSVALDGNTLAVGASSENSNQTTITNDTTSSSNNSNSASGAVYVYKRTGTTWAQEAYVKASNNDVLDAFGESVALDGDILVVGAQYEDSNQTTITNDNSTSSSNDSSSDSGAVYVYKRTGTTWEQEAYIKASNSDVSDEFSYSVELDGDTLAVGTYGEDSNQTTITNGTTSSSDNSNNNSGAVYVYSFK